jgi:transposase InsO family protein
VFTGWDVTRDNTDIYYDTNKSSVLMYNAPTSERILQMTESQNNTEKPKPFLQRIQLKGKKGTVVRATGQIDDGAMKNCISLERWERYGHCLDALTESKTIISVANATEIESNGTWTGIVQVGETGALSCFEIFDCKGAFDVILGKPWLKAVRAQHDYTSDKITIGKEGKQEVIANILDVDNNAEAPDIIPANPEREASKLPSKSPISPINEATKPVTTTQQQETTEETTADDQLAREWARVTQLKTSDKPHEETRWTHKDDKPTIDQLAKIVQSETRIKQLKNHMDILREMAKNNTSDGGGTNGTTLNAIGDVTKEGFAINRGTNTSARMTDPFNETRIQEILNAVEIGPDLTEDQREQVCSLVREYADVFALSLSEVLYVDWYKHKLNIDPSQTFPTRINQRPITEGQKEWFNNILDDMEKSYVIQKVPGDFIKSLSSTNLAPKEAGKTGITRTEVLRQVNRECAKNGLPPFWEQVTDGEDLDKEATLEAVEDDKPSTPKTKWRVCHAFNALNKATQVPPFPAGDLRAKQEFAAGHRWASVIDFAAGYYAVPLDDESVPYVAFYVEGRGYYVYLRMPFGLTGAPATFCEMVAIALDDMIGRELVNWMDDICLPGDIFETKLSNLRKFLDRCRLKNLSISPTKTKLFFTEVLFAGARVGSQGIRPNLDKVGAVVDWPIPETVQQLMGFLGLTNYFRRLISNYARIAAPLSDLTRDIKVEQPSDSWRARKGAYKRALASTSLKNKWGIDQQKAFVTLKCLLSEEPLLRPPQYDGRPFRVTTDGSMQGFAGFLSQPFTTIDGNGKETTRWHPVSYCSKRTSKSEAKYEPFLLEFAALKYSLDEFEPYIYGSPLEIETDCQALRDCLLQEKMSVHHSRWKESILAHNIIAIRHRPGVENPVADGLSRMWDGKDRTDKDGSGWSVLPNWEATKGIVNDILSISYVPPNIHPLETQFADDTFFEPIVKHLLGHDAGSTPAARRKATHQAAGFTIIDGKLWKISSKANDRVAKTECIPAAKGFSQALEAHMSNGCFGPEHIQLHLRDRYFWPGMLTDCRKAQLECPKCKSFGAATRNSALQPIRRTQPFALVAGDYLSLPVGKGGFKTVGLYIDTYSSFVWGTKLKTTGTGKTTVTSLKRIFLEYAVPKTFMSDGGSHFNNSEVDQFCDGERVQHIVTPAYAPWVNGLIENANRLLLGRLKRLCAPNYDDNEDTTTNPIPGNWPDHLDEALRQLNDRILPALNASPRELLFGLPLRPGSAIPLIPLPTTPSDTHINTTLSETFRANAHLLSLEDAERRKTSFDNNSPLTKFYIGNLVQVYDSASDFNYSAINKLAPKWSEPRIIYGEFTNSFSLCTTSGIPLKGLFHSRRLRHFIPLRGTPLDTLHPREEIIPSSADLQIAEAEERMATEFSLNQSSDAL